MCLLAQNDLPFSFHLLGHLGPIDVANACQTFWSQTRNFDQNNMNFHRFWRKNDAFEYDLPEYDLFLGSDTRLLVRFPSSPIGIEIVK